MGERGSAAFPDALPFNGMWSGMVPKKSPIRIFAERHADARVARPTLGIESPAIPATAERHSFEGADAEGLAAC